ncbi:mitochondrial import receptor subunit TOM40B, partial [Alligator sinensis]|uniref:Mitochondrial import receptor subunit TOM40B n=1 Tax=Alligator sinensis TaxID=38654 RepID=A0A1U7SBH6_ALLSI
PPSPPTYRHGVWVQLPAAASRDCLNLQIFSRLVQRTSNRFGPFYWSPDSIRRLSRRIKPNLLRIESAPEASCSPSAWHCWPGPLPVFPTLVGDIDNCGSLHAQVLHLLTERIRTKAIFQTQRSKFMTWQFDGEYRGDDCTATLTLGNPDVISESVILVAHFLQSVTSRLVLGGEMVYHRRPGEEGAIVTLAGKYTAPKWVATLNIGCGGAHASYYHKANEQVQVGVEFEANTRLQDTTFAFGYQLNLTQANVIFRGLVDSNWCVGGVLEKKLPPLPVTLALGAFLNHWKNRFHCGFSIIVG